MDITSATSVSCGDTCYHASGGGVVGWWGGGVVEGEWASLSKMSQ